MWNAPQARAASPSSTRAARQSTSRATSAPYARARPGTEAMSGSSYWPMSAVYVQGTAPLARIHATATEVSRPPEKAMPTRSPTGREVSTLDTSEIICTLLHDHPIARRNDSPEGRPAPAAGPRLLRQAGQPPCRLLGSFRMPGIHGHLVARPRGLRVRVAAQQVPEIDHRPGGHVGVTRIDGGLIGPARLPVPALPLVQMPEIPRREGRVLGMAGVDRQPVGLLGALDVAVLAEQQAQAVPGRRGVLGVRPVNRLLKRRPRPFDVALLGQPGAEAEGGRRVMREQGGLGRGTPGPPEHLQLRLPATLPVYHTRGRRARTRSGTAPLVPADIYPYPVDSRIR